MSDVKQSGSGRHTKVILVTRIYKEATNEKIAKLADEIRFLESIPKRWKKHFPEIVFSHIGKDRCFYEMPDYKLPTIRTLLFSGKWTHKETLEWLDRILEFAFEMYRKEVIPMPKYYMKELHFGRVKGRLQQLRDWTEVFKKITEKKTLTINGNKYLNTPFILRKLGIKQRSVFPEFVSKWGHFDMHFSNILIDLKKDNFRFIDPRGYKYCDYYYDYGKFWHSINGKYEFIAENRFQLNGTNFKLERNKVFKECEKIKKGLPRILEKYSGEDRETVMRKTLFNEAFHFASLVPFILDYDGIERRARVGYYTGVILLNEWYKKYNGILEDLR